MSRDRDDASQVVPAALRVLVVDDDEDVAWVIAEQVRAGGSRVRVATSARAAREALARERFDAVLSDVRMPGEDGLALLEHCRAHHRDVAFLLLTAVDEVAAAVDAMKRGATNYLIKPAAPEQLRAALDEALRERRSRVDSRRELLGESAAFRAALEDLDRAAASELSVCVVGETGVGKELFARRAHLASPRRNAPFVALNVAAIPADLFEVELFGSEKGAYTGRFALDPVRWRVRKVARSSSTSWASSRCRCKRSFFVCWRNERFDAWEERTSGGPTFDSFRRRIVI
jgi:two-component system nitrogen regulation response regulator GlnG